MSWKEFLVELEAAFRRRYPWRCHHASVHLPLRLHFHRCPQHARSGTWQASRDKTSSPLESHLHLLDRRRFRNGSFLQLGICGCHRSRSLMELVELMEWGIVCFLPCNTFLRFIKFLKYKEKNEQTNKQQCKVSTTPKRRNSKTLSCEGD